MVAICLMRMTANDLELLRQFTRDHAQDAFTELVKRHVNLVYSAALRQVRSPQLAEEVAQSVFADLARDAGKLKPGTILTAWLYQVARRTAIDAVRKESRCQLREQIAVEMNDMNATSAEWTHIEPLLDDAMDALDETDRSAILLRYFENKTLREVGVALGTSDDAAQKRVSRAVEQLREFFLKRKVTIGATGLAVLISANAVQAAPIGLAAAILAGTAVHTSTIIAATKTIAMTTLQKTVITAALAVVAGAGIYEAHQAAQLREQNQTLQQQQAPLAEQNRQLQRERDDATNRLASRTEEMANTKEHNEELLKLRGEVGVMQSQVNDPAKAAAASWANRVRLLKQRLEETPNAKIPELQFLSEQDWLDAAKGNLNTDVDYRRALSSLRNAAESHFASMLNDALGRFSKANDKQFPTDLGQLQSYFDSPVDNGILQRWEIVPASAIPNLGFGDFMITQKTAVDDMFDMRSGIGPNGAGAVDFLTTETQQVMMPIYQAYTAANNGQTFTDLSQLQPYATTSEQQAALQKLIQRGVLNH